MNFASSNNFVGERERVQPSPVATTPPTDAAVADAVAAAARRRRRRRHHHRAARRRHARRAIPTRSQVWPVVRFSTGLMAVLGVLDGLADEAWPLALRAAWKVALSCSGVYFNVQNFADGRFANRSHLVAYIAAILATALYALKTR